MLAAGLLFGVWLTCHACALWLCYEELEAAKQFRECIEQ